MCTPEPGFIVPLPPAVATMRQYAPTTRFGPRRCTTMFVSGEPPVSASSHAARKSPVASSAPTAFERVRVVAGDIVTGVLPMGIVPAAITYEYCVNVGCTVGHDPDARAVADGLYLYSNELVARPLETELDIRFPRDSVVEGVAIEPTRDRARVQLAGGAVGWIDAADLTWYSDRPAPAEVCPAGTPVKAVVLSTDLGRNTVRLSVRAATPDPWPGIPAKYPRGVVVPGVVARLIDAGVLVELEPQLRGFVPNDHVAGPVAVGQKVKVKVLGVFPADRRIRLSLRDLTEDPWARRIPQAYRPGAEFTGRVTKLFDWGVVVETEPGVTGSVPTYSASLPAFSHEAEVGV